MKKLVITFSVFVFLIGIVLMYIGYHMAQGKFWGQVYVVGDYTNFKIGTILVVVSLAVSLVAKYGFTTIKLNLFNISMKSFIYDAIKATAFIASVVGVLMIIAGFSHEGFIYVIDGVGIIIGSICLVGFSYIVEAACLYIEKQKEEAQKEENQ